MTMFNIPAQFWKRRIALLLAFSCILLYGIQISHGLPNRDIVWAPDCNPLIPLIVVKKVFLDGWNTGFYSPYPDFHRYVLCIALVPYMAVQYALGNLEGLRMGGGYPYGLEEFDTIFMHIAIITRAVSILMALGTVYFVVRIGKALFPNRPAIFGGMIIGFSPAIVFYVHTETLDVPMLFWLSGALYSYIRVLQTFELRYYVWLAILAAVSTATKDYAYGAFVLMPIPLVWYLTRKKSRLVTIRTVFASFFDRKHQIALIVFVIAFILAENLIWNPSGFINHVKLAAGAEEGSIISTDFGRFDVFSFGRIAQFGRIMPFVLGWIALPFCIAGMLFVGVRHLRACIWLVWPLASCYVFTVVPVLPDISNIERPIMPIGLILAVFGGQLLGTLWSMPNARIFSRSVCVLAVLGMFANGFAMTAALVHDTRYQLEQWFSDNLSENASIEFYGYRRHSTRSNAKWKVKVLNHRESPSYSDIRISTESIFFEGLQQRNPDILVVAEPYANAFKKQSKYVAELGIYSAGNKFFHLLEKEQLGYRRVTSFQPSLGFLFGMGKLHQKIPNITVYERANQNLLN